MTDWTPVPPLRPGELDLGSAGPSGGLEIFIDTTDTWRPTRTTDHVRGFIDFSIVLCRALESALMFCTDGEGEEARSATFELAEHQIATLTTRPKRSVSCAIFIVSCAVRDRAWFAPLAQIGGSIEERSSFCVAVASEL